MSSLKTGIFALLTLIGAPAGATPLWDVFATCTGRYSAELEHAWLMQDPAADRLHAQRAAFVDLLSAVMTEDDARLVLDHRIRAKMAHARILGRASFSQDAQTARWAARRAEVEIGYCDSLLLTGGAQGAG